MRQTAVSLGIAERVSHVVRDARRVAAQKADPGLPPALEAYWLEVTALTADLRKAAVSAFRDKPSNVLLLMSTRDFDPLEFVLVQKSLRQSRAPGAQVAVSHRLLSVDRRNPSHKHVSVLERMRNKAADPYAQFDRLKDAFEFAEWSEDEFNNRNLFSDYFLKRRLTIRELFPVWHEDCKPAQREFERILEAAGEPAKLAPPGYASRFISPVLAALGFAAERVEGEDVEVDYLLRPRAAAEGGPACAGLLVYPWDRPLDRKDDQERDRAEDVPGIRVVKALERGKLGWVILTNGKDWRLYCAKANSRASNYYEIDLPATLECEDLNAFRYFYLFFRAEAFTTVGAASSRDEDESRLQTAPTCFLDRLRHGSAAFAKELGDRLRGHIFDDVFPYLAQGFVDYRREHFDEATAAGDPFLNEVYDATLTLLYRLLFLLYAESLDLLPTHEPAYAAVSLTRMKDEIAEAAGKDTDAVETRLKDRYSRSDTDLHKRLADLFKVIDEGSKDHNVPAYNGGLFETAPEARDRSREAAAARFLKKYRVPDFYLARAIDLLARAEDDKSHELVFVDYKALGVRQLGNIYEGLLMYHVVFPRDEWELGFRRPGLKVALVPSNKQRKSTGSYFTPQHIVKHIVSNTVGPLLAEKFEALTPKLRAAQREHAETREFEHKRAEKLRVQTPRTDDDIARIVADKHESAVWDLFDLKVLDPAAGSGHFLVETVDFITDKVLDLIAGFPWNPVQVLIDHRVRRPIIESLDEQGIKINEDRLTDVNLIKRLVMKRCVYGVDLNPMAVELAKVSLWLDSFTLGAPLSFLDHHLKCGNSLIGSTIESMRRTITEGGSLFPFPMHKLEAATKNMESIADLTDATLTEVAKSADTYLRVLADVKGFRALLDCLTAQHFGQPKAADIVIRAESLGLRVDDWERSLAGVHKKMQEIIRESMRLSSERRFFHWDIDFPDVFFTARREPERRAFDAVLGNPPYDELSEYAAGEELPEKEYLEENPLYGPAKGGRQNLFRFFVVRAGMLLRTNGVHGFIVPMALLTDQFTLALRKWLLQRFQFIHVDQFPQKDDPARRVFVEAKLSTCVYSLRRMEPTATHTLTVRTHPWNVVDPNAAKFEAVQSEFCRLDPENCSIPSYDALEWETIKKLATAPRASQASSVLKAYPGEVMLNAQFEPYLAKRGQVLLRGAHIGRYEFHREPKQGEAAYLNVEKYRRDKQDEGKAGHHLRPRLGYQRGSAIDNYRRLIACWIESGQFCTDTVGYVVDPEVGLQVALAWFNSALCEWRFARTSTNNHVNAYEVEALPFPKLTPDAGGEPAHRDKQVPGGKGQPRTVLAGQDGCARFETDVFGVIASVGPEQPAWPSAVHDSLAVSAEELCRLVPKQANAPGFFA